MTCAIVLSKNVAEFKGLNVRCLSLSCLVMAEHWCSDKTDFLSDTHGRQVASRRTSRVFRDKWCWARSQIIGVYARLDRQVSMTHQPVLVLRPLPLHLRTRATARGESDMIQFRTTTARDDFTLVEYAKLRGGEKVRRTKTPTRGHQGHRGERQKQKFCTGASPL